MSPWSRNSRHVSVPSCLSSNSALPSRLASKSSVTTVLLRLLGQPPAQLFLEPCGSFLHGHRLVNLVVQALGPLFRDALLDTLLDSGVFLHQLVAMLVHVLDNGVEFLAREARHRLPDELEVVAAVKVVEDVHYCQTVAFDLCA